MNQATFCNKSFCPFTTVKLTITLIFSQRFVRAPVLRCVRAEPAAAYAGGQIQGDEDEEEGGVLAAKGVRQGCRGAKGYETTEEHPPVWQFLLRLLPAIFGRGHHR